MTNPMENPFADVLDSRGNRFRSSEEQRAEFGNALSAMPSPSGIYHLLVLMDSAKKPLAQNGYPYGFISPMFNIQACIQIARNKAREYQAEWAVLLDYKVATAEYTSEIHIKINPNQHKQANQPERN